MSTILILLSLAVVTVAAGKVVYCDVEKHEFYVKQWGQCKACDRCPRGYGLDSKRDVKMDPVHGALHCRMCVKCVTGETFNSEIGYGECVKCTNCTTQGKTAITPCSIKTDTVCSKTVIPENIQSPQNEPRSISQRQTNSDSKSDSEDNIGKRNKENDTDFNPTLMWSGVVAIVIVIPLSVAMFFTWKREKLNCWKRDIEISGDIPERESLNEKQNTNVPVTLESVVESVPLNTMESKEYSAEDTSRSCARQSVVSEDMPPLDSNFYFSLSSNILNGDDVMVDADNLSTSLDEVPSDRKQHEISDEIHVDQTQNKRLREIPTDKELQDICPDIAYNNHYVRLGRELGVKDCEIQRIKEEQKNDLLETAFQTVKKWREIKGNLATKSVLQQALRKCGLSNVTLIDDP